MFTRQPNIEKIFAAWGYTPPAFIWMLAEACDDLKITSVEKRTGLPHQLINRLLNNKLREVDFDRAEHVQRALIDHLHFGPIRTYTAVELRVAALSAKSSPAANDPQPWYFPLTDLRAADQINRVTAVAQPVLHCQIKHAKVSAAQCETLREKYGFMDRCKFCPSHPTLMANITARDRAANAIVDRSIYYPL
jgi:hypothetical protein